MHRVGRAWPTWERKIHAHGDRGRQSHEGNLADGTEIPTTPKGQWDCIALQMVDIFQCHTSHQVFPATAPLSEEQLKKGGIIYHFHGHT